MGDRVDTGQWLGRGTTCDHIRVGALMMRLRVWIALQIRIIPARRQELVQNLATIRPRQEVLASLARQCHRAPKTVAECQVLPVATSSPQLSKEISGSVHQLELFGSIMQFSNKFCSASAWIHVAGKIVSL